MHNDILQRAITDHHSGQLAQAEAGYRRLLAIQPTHPDANHNLGVLAVQVGQVAAALPYLKTALENRPDQPQFWLSYLDALIHAGEVGAARQALAQGQAMGLAGEVVDMLSARLSLIINHSPSESVMQTLVGLFNAQQFHAVEQLARAMTEQFPATGFGWKALGAALHKQGMAHASLEAMQRAVALLPDDVDALSNLGNVQQEVGRPADAEASYRQVLMLKPDSAEAYNSLGYALQTQGRLAEAKTCYDQAIQLRPDHVNAHNNLGNALQAQGKLTEAEYYYRRALVLRPDYVNAHNNLGSMLQAQGRLAEAQASYQQVLVLQPDFAEAYNNLGNVLKAQGWPNKAEANYRQALVLRPDYTDANNNLLFTTLYTDTISPTTSFSEHLHYGQCIAAHVAPLRRTHVQSSAPLNRPLRIGWVSADLRRHAVTYFLEPLLQQLRAQNFSLFAYANSHLQDEMTTRIRQHLDGWREVAGMTDAELVAQIVTDQIDILIDLSGHTAGNRLPVFACKPAPVQVTWLGYPATTGVPGMDWRITDVHAEPEGLTEHLNTEKLWRLPEIFCCYQPSPNSPEPLPGLPCETLSPAERVQGLPPELAQAVDPAAQVMTLGCFNNFAKVTPPVITLWSQILSRLPQARLLLEIHGGQDPQFTADVRQRFVQAGARPEQIHIVPRKPEHQYALYRQLDLALDPFPCTGGTTSCDSLWMGVPFVTLAGEWFVGRMGVTLLHNAGLDELIAHSPAEYADKVVALVNDLPRLRTIRHGLRERVAASPIMDSERFGQHFAQALRGMWAASSGQTSSAPPL